MFFYGFLLILRNFKYIFGIINSSYHGVTYAIILTDVKFGNIPPPPTSPCFSHCYNSLLSQISLRVIDNCEQLIFIILCVQNACFTKSRYMTIISYQFAKVWLLSPKCDDHAHPDYWNICTVSSLCGVCGEATNCVWFSVVYIKCNADCWYCSKIYKLLISTLL